MGWFSKKTDPGNPKFTLLPGTFKNVWERKAMPDPGAQNYAYESLGLVQFTPVGPTVRARDYIRSTQATVYALHAVPTNGIPTVSGGIVGQPLYDPNAPPYGYTHGIPARLSELIAANVPIIRNDALPNNDPDPTKL